MSKILVIDSKIDYLISTKALLKAILNEATILTSTSGREGLIKAENEVPDVIVIKISLPGLSCATTCKILNNNKNTHHIPILIITNPDTTSQEKIEVLESGADALINSPLKIPELSAQIKALLRIRNLEKDLIYDNKNLSASLKITDKKLHDTNALTEAIYNDLPMGLAIIENNKISFLNKYLINFLNITKPIETLNLDDFIENWTGILDTIHSSMGFEKTHTIETSIKDTTGNSRPAFLSVNQIDTDNGNYILNITDISEISASKKVQEIILKIHSYSNEIEENTIFLSKIYDLINDIIPLKHFYIGLFDNYENIIKISFITQENQYFAELSNTNNLASKVIQTKSTLLLKEKEIKILRSRHQTNSLESKAKSWLGIPLLNNNHLIGLMAMQDNENDNAFDKSQIDKLNLIAGPVAAILESRINNEKLSRALAKAQESEKLKSGFLSNISHEIRTPLNAVIGFSSMLYDEVSPQEKKEYLDLIITNGDNLLKVIDDIVDLAKIESGNLKINQIDSNVKQLLNKIYEKFSLKINTLGENLKFKLDIPNDFDNFLIKTDPFRLTQILENLVSNAIKFTSHGTITMGISFINKETLNFYVKDTGIGIPKDKIDSIFQRFYQVETGHIREYGGNGIGLSITKKLVELLNGKIYVDSQEGKGSIFRFTLPINEAKFLSNQPHFGGKATYEWDDKKILLVDDVISNLEYLDILLRKTKAKTFWAQNGKKALETYQAERDIDIIIMDLQMPIMDGYKATRLIKEINPKVPIIIQTAFNEISNEKLAFESGCDHYLQKPIEPNQLLETIDNYL